VSAVWCDAAILFETNVAIVDDGSVEAFEKFVVVCDFEVFCFQRRVYSYDLAGHTIDIDRVLPPLVVVHDQFAALVD
jgi:hypothetical protein